MFEALSRDGKIMGYSLKRDRGYYFFGTRWTCREDLPKLFPQYEFCFLKQVHGREVIEAVPAQMPEADGHFTSIAGRALVAQSADCLPLLFGSKDQVCAVHAGWKGMAANIIQATLERIHSPHFVAMGPHILKQSFEVGRDVAERLMLASPQQDPSLILPSADSQKVYFDLRGLAHHQLAKYKPLLTECLLDTKTDSLFHSFRRDRGSNGRQYSFVVLDS